MNKPEKIIKPEDVLIVGKIHEKNLSELFVYVKTKKLLDHLKSIGKPAQDIVEAIKKRRSSLRHRGYSKIGFISLTPRTADNVKDLFRVELPENSKILEVVTRYAVDTRVPAFSSILRIGIGESSHIKLIERLKKSKIDYLCGLTLREDIAALHKKFHEKIGSLQGIEFVLFNRYSKDRTHCKYIIKL